MNLIAVGTMVKRAEKEEKDREKEQEEQLKDLSDEERAILQRILAQQPGLGRQVGGGLGRALVGGGIGPLAGTDLCPTTSSSEEDGVNKSAAIGAKLKQLMPKILAKVPGSKKLSDYARGWGLRRLTGLSDLAKKYGNDKAQRMVRRYGVKALGKINTPPKAGGAIAGTGAGLGTLAYALSGGDPDELSEQEAAELGEKTTRSVGTRGLGSLAGGIGGLALGDAMDLEGGARTLSAVVPGVAGAFSPEIVEAVSESL